MSSSLGFPSWLEGSVQCPRTRPRINTARAGRAAAQPRRLIPRAQKVKYIYLLPSPGGSVTPKLWGSARGKGSAGRELKGSSVVSHGSLNTWMAPPARRCCEMSRFNLVPSFPWYRGIRCKILVGNILKFPSPRQLLQRLLPAKVKKGGRQKSALSINLFAIRGE